MRKRTDLALELRENIISEAKDKKGEIDGIICEEYKAFDKFPTVKITVDNENAEKILGKAKGNYITISFNSLQSLSYEDFILLADTLSKELKHLIYGINPPINSALVLGLGNINITPDSIGPRAVENIMITRHIKENYPEIFEDAGFFEISALSPGVVAQTGIEAVEILKGAILCAKPDCVIAIDALASQSIDRLGKCVQLTDTGIIPGSGVGNHRHAIDKATLGVPVISIGVPTIVDTATVIFEALESLKSDAYPKIPEIFKGVFVSPNDMDILSRELGKLLGFAINKAFHPNLQYEEMARL